MATTRFEFGERAKHQVTVEWSLVSKQLRIELDGEVVVSEWHLSPFARKVELSVEAPEPHRLLVIAGGLHATELRVDGVKIPPSP